MTKEEAIKVLKDLRIFDDDCEEDCKAIDLGISALEKQIKLNKIGFTEEVIENYKVFEDECITKGFTFKSLLDAIDKPINGGWVKCSERLPEYTDNYNVTVGIGSMLGYFEEVRTYRYEIFNGKNPYRKWIIPNNINEIVNVIAWQNLPAQYQESEVL